MDLTNLRCETDFLWNASITDFFVKPFDESGKIGTNHGNWSYLGFHSVMGTTIDKGNRPIAVELTTTAGRVFWISSPMLGSNLISQIFPRRG